MIKEGVRLKAPIPGQSLTDEPKGYAWERPAEFTTTEDALKYYLPRLTDKEIVEDMMLALENGFPLATLVKGIYMNGVMEGKHSIDIGLLIAPVLHELILATAKDYGIKVKELPVSENERIKKRQAEQVRNAVAREVELGLSEDESLEESMVSTDEGAENVPQEQEKMPDTPKEGKGLMARSM